MLHTEPPYYTSQAGVLEVHRAPPVGLAHNDWQQNLAALQMVITPPIDTCYGGRMLRPIALVGDVRWHNMLINLDFLLRSYTLPASLFTDGILLAVRVPVGSCELHAGTPYGIYLYIYANCTWQLFHLFSMFSKLQVLPEFLKCFRST